MIKRTVACVGIATLSIAALLLAPANGLAKSFTVQGAHLRSFHHHNQFYPYGPYGPVATYTPGDYGQPVIVMPTQYAPVITVVEPHCTRSRETITVPAEGGGERQVTITRCP